jgi:hypothetical protein
MKLSKPVYNQEKKIYICDVKGATDFIYTSYVTSNPVEYNPTPKFFFEETLPKCISILINITQGWFSQALTEEWLIPRLTYGIPTEKIPNGFEGTVIYHPVRLHISKESFVLEFDLTDMKEEEKVRIVFQEDTPEVPKEVVPATEDPGVRRRMKKELVLQARRKAARALFKAERLLNSFVTEYGEDTDWDEDDETDSS